MEKNKGNKIKLGVFVAVGLVLFIIGIYYIGKKQQLFNSTFRISGIFKNISGLQVGNNVRFAGINVGVIDNIQIISDTAVEVDFDVQEKVRKFIMKDSKAIIGSDGLIGNKILIIIPGTTSKEEIKDNDFIKTTNPVSMEDIMYSLNKTSKNAADITGNLSVIVDNIREGKGTIGQLFMDTVFAENIDQAIVNIKQGAGGFKNNMDAVGHNFLLRGYLKKKEKKEAKEAKEKEAKDNSTK